MKKTFIKASTLRVLLSFSLLVMLSGAVGGFYLAQDWFRSFAVEINTSGSTSSASNNAQNLIKIREEITKNQAIGEKASDFFASTQNYQTQIIADLNSYATASGITLTNTTWKQSVADAAGIISRTGFATQSITVTLQNPVILTNLLQFMKSIESNLPKMQISSINISPIANSKTSVTIDPLTIEVYTR